MIASPWMCYAHTMRIRNLRVNTAMIKQRKPNPDRLTLTIPEASKFLGIGLNQAYAAAEKGNIPTVKIGDRVLVLRKALMKMLGEDAA